MNEALTMEQILDNEDRREATQLSIDDWVARARKFEAEVAAWKGTCEQETFMGNRWKDHADRLLSRAEKAGADLSRQRRLRKRSINFARFYNMKRQMAADEAKELWAVFNMQQTRMGKATKLWQQATGEHHTLPDLGVLLDWLMGEIERLKKAGNEALAQIMEMIEKLNKGEL